MDELAVRLEGAWPMLDAARLQYRAVVSALRAWRWRTRLERVADVAREVARRDGEVAEQLERALRRREAERWPDGPVTRTLTELASLRASLSGALGGSPGGALRALLRDVLLAPRALRPEERLAVASEALTLDPELLPALDHFGRGLERLFARPSCCSLAEYDAFLATWPAGKAALAQAWAELERVDTSGRLVPSLQARAPYGAAPAPIATLLRADFWSGTARARRTALLSAAFAPARVRPEEEAAAFRYLLSRREGGAGWLEGARGALLMLAHELGPGARPPLPGGRATLRAWAWSADGSRTDPDWERVRAGLACAPVQHLRARALALPRPPERLAELFSARDEP